MNGIFIVLLVFSAFTMNLTLQCALGIKGAAEAGNYGKSATLIKLSVIFLSVIMLWFFFSGVIFSVFSGIFIYVILFPVSYILYETLDFLIFNYLLKKPASEFECFISFPGGITAAAVFICLNLADSFLETIVLSFGFTSGILLVLLIIREIRRRAALEAVPVFLRGKPLVLITMGMLSLIFSTASLLVLRIISVK